MTYTWTPPFSENLTTADPDIIYCVEVSNSNGTLFIDCSVTKPKYTVVLGNYTNEQLNIKVTPRSNLIGAIAGQGSIFNGFPKSKDIIALE